MSELQSANSVSGVPRLCLSVFEAAKSVGLSEKHFREEVLPCIPHLRVGRRIVIPVDGLREWLSEQSRKN
ncbi:MAG: hypothetical protein ACKVII_26900 [Planctomycetales bacterium]|jgi:hypothetical protein